MNKNTLSRFSNHAGDYHRYRPRYPEAILTFLEQTIGIDASKAIADIGSGTGIFTELFLKKGYSVSAVEPNRQMREEAEKTLNTYPNLKIVDGTAENSKLDSLSIDLITVAQSFHWFDPESVKTEFKRIAKAGAHVLLVWNVLQQRTPFLKAYQEIKNKYSDPKPYLKQVDEDMITKFFAPAGITRQEIYHSRLLDQDELLGYFRSSSYAPLQGENRYPDLVEDIEQLFKAHQKSGFVKLEYSAQMYLSSTAFQKKHKPF